MEDLSDEELHEAYLEEYGVLPGEEGSSGSITSIPTLGYYQKSYAGSLGNNDQKAVKVFKQYEGLEKVRRLQSELGWIANKQVYEPVLDSIASRTRKTRYKGYDAWAKLMLQWLAQAKV